MKDDDFDPDDDFSRAVRSVGNTWTWPDPPTLAPKPPTPLWVKIVATIVIVPPVVLVMSAIVWGIVAIWRAIW